MMHDQTEMQQREQRDRQLVNRHPEWIDVGLHGFATSGRGVVLVTLLPEESPTAGTTYSTTYWTFNTIDPDINPWTKPKTRRMVDMYDPTCQVVIMLLRGKQDIALYTVASQTNLTA